VAERGNRFIHPANFFLIVGLLVGIFYCVAIPYGAGFDEERHLVRIYYMSEYEFLPVFSEPSIHQDVFALSYQRRFVQSPAFDMFARENFTRRFSTFNDLRYGQQTQSIYSPVIFLPQALIGRLLWWKYDFLILPTIILQRIAGFLIYVAAGYFAIRTVPVGKWVFAMLALSPTAMFQASTLNADGFTTGISFAFIGLVLEIYLNERAGIRLISLWALILLSLLLGVSKPGAIILFPLLLLIIKQPFPSKKWIVFLSLTLLFATVFNVGWSVFATNVSTYGASGEQSVSRQSSLILSDPLGFLVALLQGMWLTFPYQLQGWVAAYGYWAGKVPDPLYLFWAVCLIAALVADSERREISYKIRIFLIGFFLFCCIAFYTIAFIGNYATGGVLALAKHGRYYVPFAPMFFLGISGWMTVNENKRRLAEYIVAGSLLVVTGLYSLGIYTTYYSYCGYDAYVGGGCILPTYKNLEKEDAPEEGITGDVVIRQTFTNQCGRLETVRVYISYVPEDSNGQLLFTLLDENRNMVTQQEIPFREIVPDDYLIVGVDLPPDSRGGEYEIQLRAVNVKPQEEITVLFTRGDYYAGELVSGDGSAKRTDLLIHYSCAGP